MTASDEDFTPVGVSERCSLVFTRRDSVTWVGVATAMIGRTERRVPRVTGWGRATRQRNLWLIETATGTWRRKRQASGTKARRACLKRIVHGLRANTETWTK